LRYDTGDIGTVVRESDGTYIYDIQGRIHDTVSINGEDYATHFIMDYLDHKIRNIREFQIHLNDSAAPTLNIVPESEADSDRIRAEIIQRWPQGLDITFIKYEDLQKVGWRQKFRHIIDQRVNINE
jgi:phenylacetate-coenzyme A ligase PaaK-like adenylate-forming protein